MSQNPNETPETTEAQPQSAEPSGGARAAEDRVFARVQSLLKETDAAADVSAPTPTEPPPERPRVVLPPHLQTLLERFEERIEQRADPVREEAPPPPPPQAAELEQLKNELAQKDELLRRYIAEHKKAVGEFDRVRQRLTADVDNRVRAQVKRTLVELLEVLDNLDRAVAGGERGADAAALLEGVTLLRDQFLHKLGRLGVTRLTSLGEAFDPNRHDAAATLAVADEAQHNRVVGVMSEGYLLGDELLRPAVVAVGQKA